ncbi:MAG: diacylglycerol kinase family protein [Myxococcota bacterium]
MMERPRSLAWAFVCAGEGVADALQQRNMKIHWVCALAVMLVGSTVPFTGGCQAALMVTAGLVLAAESFNCAVEAAVDLATREYHPLAKQAKDASAGAVLVLAIFAASTLGVVLYSEWNLIVWPDAFTTIRFGVPLLAVTALAMWGRRWVIGLGAAAAVPLLGVLAGVSRHPVFFGGAILMVVLGLLARLRELQIRGREHQGRDSQ